MIDDVLEAIRDLFDGDATMMLIAAVVACGSGVALIVAKLVEARKAVSRRVSGGDEEAPAGETAEGARERLGVFIANIAKSAGEGEESHTSVLRARLIMAGIYDRQAVTWFFGLRLVCALALASLFATCDWLINPAGPLAEMGAAALAGLAIGFMGPSVALDRRIERCKREHSSGFPDFMDLMVVCAQAGLSMEASINRIANEIGVGFPSLARNLALAAREIRSGKPLSKAIESLAVRLGIAEAAAFSTLLQQSEELGSSLTQSLRTYSEDMRNKRMMKAEEKAYALPAKLVVPLTLFVFPTLLVVLLLPVVISVSGAKI